MKYVATIVEKYKIVDNIYLFNPISTIIGELEEDVFKDKEGKTYDLSGNIDFIKSDKKYAVSYLISYPELKKRYGRELTIKKALEEYKNEFINICSIANIYEKDRIFYCNVNIKEQMDELKNNLQKNQEEDIEIDWNDEEDEEYDNEELKERIIAGEFTLKELKDMKETIENEQNQTEELLDTINLQIEATEKGESSTELKKEEENTIPFDVEDLYNKITTTLIAQEEPTRHMISEVVKRLIIPEKRKEGILLTGASGVGKTELMRLIAKHCKIPFYIIDSTKLTAPGYVGTDIEEELWNLYEKCGKNKTLAEHSIVYFDEIDKKGSAKKSDISGQAVLNTLLKFIEGQTYEACKNTKTATETVKIDTSNMIVILGGAFTDVYNNLNTKNSIGFNNEIKENKQVKATITDFETKAMMPKEFMGRVNIIKLNDLNVDAIKRVMLESDKSALKVQQKLFENIGVKLTFTDDYTSAIAKEAYERKTGARGLNTVIDESSWDAFYEACKEPNNYEEVVLNADTLKNPKQYKLIKKTKKLG